MRRGIIRYSIEEHRRICQEAISAVRIVDAVAISSSWLKPMILREICRRSTSAFNGGRRDVKRFKSKTDRKRCTARCCKAQRYLFGAGDRLNNVARGG